MKFLFNAAIPISDQLFYFNVHELEDGRFEAEFLPGSKADPGNQKQIILWKEDGFWKTERIENSDLAERLGDEIDLHNK